MRKIYTLLFTTLAFVALAASVMASPPRATIEYQPMTSQGLAAGYPFEAWVVFDKSSNPAEPGYALPAGATFRFTFPPAFTLKPDIHPESVLLYDLPQKAAPIPFSVGLDPQNPRAIILKLKEAFPVGPPERPGLKAIHLLGSAQSYAARKLSDLDRNLGCWRVIWDHAGHRPHHLSAGDGHRCLQSASRGPQ